MKIVVENVSDEMHEVFQKMATPVEMQKLMAGVMMESLKQLRKENIDVWEQVFRKYNLDHKNKYHYEFGTRSIIQDDKKEME